MNGTLGNLNVKQQEKLNQLKINLEDILLESHDDHMLLRFLRARSFNLKTTEVLFRKDLKWKNQMQTSSLSIENSPEVLRKYWPGGCCGFDKEGSPVWIDPFGKCDLRGLLYSSKASDIFKHNVAILESLYQKMQQQSHKLESHVEGIIYIADMEGFGLHHLWKPGVDVVNRNVALFEQHYPETLKKIFVINAPTIFPIAYSLVKPFLQENTRKKISVLGSNWKETLLKHIDANELPLHWGGEARGQAGDPNCTHQVMLGGKVPESYYIKERHLSSQEVLKYELSRGSSLELKYDVHQPGSVLRYEFHTKKNDIAFGVQRIAEDGGRVDVLPIQRYNCHMVWEDGEISLQLPGQYIVIFDNSYSWTKSKKMMYWVELLEPADEDPDKEPKFQEAVSDSLQDMDIFE
ncbi:SEC14-like protein 2 isoform X1 [Asterias rubens]|uniref:SEC14-like protein 2 isoform X1 n=1 Tax=Asterias rubens TaxID=7604 RepID=UPI00145508D1|nr:SEC14-like protein 2 isoform X1 [Asterias rubens]XP_033627186.1 SEC14-like protein 2 isoform X1 [Asterias rubens]